MKQFDEKILEVKNLQTYFFTDEGTSKAVNGISFTLNKGETLGIVGESGSGKSITSLSLLRLIQSPPGKITGGSILFKGEDLLTKTEKQMRSIRGNEISMIFQEPMTSLNPVYSAGEQIAEAIRLHQKLGKKEAWNKAVDMLRLVGIPSPEKRAKQEPHELSGGMRQRVMIAMALACHPEVLIADEPTTALDVTIQAQILELIKTLQKDFGTAVILITHDLGVVYETCDRVAVMYAGKIVEYTPAKEIFTNPKHPYTIGLLNSLPRLDMDQEELTTIPGTVPSPYNMPKGCSFAPRCAHAKRICEQAVPDLQSIGPSTQVSCWMFTPQWEKDYDVQEKVGV
ncbi:ABC transporter ATP-binding protein [Peribacillus sp. NPDC097895]|uniref:ABC transporter ATP-binding protein n=1 Tax=Peribacillus sp. NPDC097895 TaxID=3390619 RepID=UPI003D01992D